MANYRSIHVKLWSKQWFEEADSNQKLLFVYLLTNPYRNESGLYELSKKRIVSDTGLTENAVDKALEELEKIHRVYWRSGWIFVANVLKYANLNENGRSSVRRDFQVCKVSELKDKLWWMYGADLEIDWESSGEVESPVERIQVEEKKPVEEKPKEMNIISKWIIDSGLVNVQRLKKQLTDEECVKLLAKWDKAAIKKVLEAMENKADLTKKYTSVYLTCNGWLNRDGSSAVKVFPKGRRNESTPSVVADLAKTLTPKPEWAEVLGWWSKLPKPERIRVRAIIASELKGSDPIAHEKIISDVSWEGSMNILVKTYLIDYYTRSVWASPVSAKK